jgi:hypothetical protein
LTAVHVAARHALFADRASLREIRRERPEKREEHAQDGEEAPIPAFEARDPRA